MSDHAVELRWALRSLSVALGMLAKADFGRLQRLRESIGSRGSPEELEYLAMEVRAISDGTLAPLAAAIERAGTAIAGGGCRGLDEASGHRWSFEIGQRLGSAGDLVRFAGMILSDLEETPPCTTRSVLGIESDATRLSAFFGEAERAVRHSLATPGAIDLDEVGDYKPISYFRLNAAEQARVRTATSGDRQTMRVGWKEVGGVKLYSVDDVYAWWPDLAARRVADSMKVASAAQIARKSAQGSASLRKSDE